MKSWWRLEGSCDLPLEFSSQKATVGSHFSVRSASDAASGRGSGPPVRYSLPFFSFLSEVSPLIAFSRLRLPIFVATCLISMFAKISCQSRELVLLSRRNVNLLDGALQDFEGLVHLLGKSLAIVHVVSLCGRRPSLEGSHAMSTANWSSGTYST